MYTKQFANMLILMILVNFCLAASSIQKQNEDILTRVRRSKEDYYSIEITHSIKYLLEWIFILVGSLQNEPDAICRENALLLAKCLIGEVFKRGKKYRMDDFLVMRPGK